MSFLEDFKNFAFKGNVVDLAVGVVIGGAFNDIVKGVVANVIMPLVSLALPEGDWRTAKIILQDNADPEKAKVLTYGALLGSVLDFLVVALFLFIIVAKIIPALMRSKKEEATAPETPTKDQVLLEEIRDLLKANAAK